jgi:hypothetical protein
METYLIWFVILKSGDIKLLKELSLAVIRC